MLEKINLEISIPSQWQSKEYMSCTTENSDWVTWKMLRGAPGHLKSLVSVLFLGSDLRIEDAAAQCINCNGFNWATELHRSGGIIELSKARQS